MVSGLEGKRLKFVGWTDWKSNVCGICISGIEKVKPGNKAWFGVASEYAIATTRLTTLLL